MEIPSKQITVDDTHFIVEYNPDTCYIESSIIGKGSVEFARAMAAMVQEYIDTHACKYWLINLEESHDPPHKEERQLIMSLLKANPDCRFAQFGGSHIIAAVTRFAIAAMGPKNISAFASKRQAERWLQQHTECG